MKSKMSTKTIRERINAEAGRFLRGEIDADKLYGFVLQEGNAVWQAIINKTLERHSGYVHLDDLNLIVKEAIYESIKRLRPDGNPFAYIRRWVKGRICEYLKRQAFPFTVHLHRNGDGIERISLDEILDEIELDGECVPEPLIYPDRAFELVEIADLADKTLTKLERRVFWLLYDGHTPSEIATQLGLERKEVFAMVRRVRLKMRKALIGGWRI